MNFEMPALAAEGGEHPPEKGLMQKLAEAARSRLARIGVAFALVMAAERGAAAKEAAKEAKGKAEIELLERIEKETAEGLNVGYAFFDAGTKKGGYRYYGTRLEVRDTKGTTSDEDDFIGACDIIRAEKDDKQRFVMDCEGKGWAARSLEVEDKVREKLSRLDDFGKQRLESDLNGLADLWTYYQGMKAVGKAESPEGRYLRDDLIGSAKKFEERWGGGLLKRQMLDELAR